MRTIRRLVIGMVAVLVTSLESGVVPAHATTPGHNGRILFAGDLGRGLQLYTIEPNGTDLRQITDVVGDATTADWSPDGHHIVFEHDWAAQGKDHARIVLVNADGTNMHDVTTRGRNHQPSFTPDGHHIVYECECHPDGIFIMRTDGTERRRLSTNPFHDTDTDPNVSPDGQTVTFVRHKVEDVLQALFAVDIDGTNERQLTTYKLEVAIKHDWAPDGGHILIGPHVDRPRGQTPQIATIRPDGTALRFLTHVPRALAAVAGSYSPNGRWIVFRIVDAEHARVWLYKIHPDGSNRTLIARMPFAFNSVDWGTQP